jgi:uncharacterized protein
MKFLIDIGHPADFLLYKEFALSVQKKGHDVFFTARDKDVLVDLIRSYGFNFTCFGRSYPKIFGKIYGVFKFDLQLLIWSIRFRPDMYLSAGSIYASHVSFILRKPHVVCEDTGNNEQIKLYEPFTATILTSTSFRRKLGKKQVYYDGCHELAYLHPNYFKPDKDKISILLNNNFGRYIIIRFVSWTASHDFGLKGFTPDEKRILVNELSKYAQVYISSEQELPADLLKFRLPVNPRDLHHALAFASLVIGEGATVASEAAVLGTPAIYINPQSLGYLEELEKYGLVTNFRKFSPEILEKAKAQILDITREKEINENHLKYLRDKIDVTAFLVWFLTNYPESLKSLNENPELQSNFK